MNRFSVDSFLFFVPASLLTAVFLYFFMTEKWTPPLPNDRNGQVKCLVGNCWILQRYQVDVIRLLPGQTHEIYNDDQIITMNSGSGAQVELKNQNGHFTMRNTSLVRITPHLKISEMTYYQTALGDLSEATGEEGFPEPGTSPGTQVAASSKTPENALPQTSPPEEGTAEKNKKTKLSTIPFLENPDSTFIVLGQDRLELRSPDPGKIYVALEFPVKIPLSFTYSGKSNLSRPRHEHWQLIKFDATGSNAQIIKEFDVQPSTIKDRSGKVWFSYDTTIMEAGKYAYLATLHTEGSTEQPRALGFEVIAKQQYQSKLIELFKVNTQKNKAKIEIIQRPSR